MRVISVGHVRVRARQAFWPIPALCIAASITPGLLRHVATRPHHPGRHLDGNHWLPSSSLWAAV